MHFDNAEAERSNFSAGSLAQLQRYQNELKQLFLFFLCCDMAVFLEKVGHFWLNQHRLISH